ncbi:hypothetical protein Syun_021632 [Stephania yunnanensis]|uniref:Uncharacterized protein n=1 Tax=Stephania yunnanensis TaxID=152371 RepID=A0AAP0NR95_9MAGN
MIDFRAVIVQCFQIEYDVPMAISRFKFSTSSVENLNATLLHIGFWRGCSLICVIVQVKKLQVFIINRLSRSLAQGAAGIQKKVMPWHEQGMPWHEQGMPWQGLTNLDLGFDPGQREVVSLRGGMDTVARKTLEHALGTMPRQDPDPWFGHPEPAGTRPSPG